MMIQSPKKKKIANEIANESFADNSSARETIANSDSRRLS